MEYDCRSIGGLFKRSQERMKLKLIKRDNSESKPRFELTALIDVIFILVLFFAVSTSFQQERKGLNLTLPTAVSVEKPKESITISIDRNQRIYWNGTRVGQGHIATRVQEAIAQNPKQQIVLQADKSTPYVRIISVLDAIRSSGCSNVMLEAEKT